MNNDVEVKWDLKEGTILTIEDRNGVVKHILVTESILVAIRKEIKRYLKHEGY